MGTEIGLGFLLEWGEKAQLLDPRGVMGYERVVVDILSLTCARSTRISNGRHHKAKTKPDLTASLDVWRQPNSIAIYRQQNMSMQPVSAICRLDQLALMVGDFRARSNSPSRLMPIIAQLNRVALTRSRAVHFQLSKVDHRPSSKDQPSQSVSIYSAARNSIS